MPKVLKLKLPHQYAIDERVMRNPIQQIRKLGATVEVEAEAYLHRDKIPSVQFTVDGQVHLMLSSNYVPDRDHHALMVTKLDLTAGVDVLESVDLKPKWKIPEKDSLPPDLAGWQQRCEGVRDSWRERFEFCEEVREDEEVTTKGLRPPQLGALYATLGHWVVSDEVATIVMPTGTGKTETMLSILTHQRLERLLVVVPTGALRDQIGEKFLTLGILPEFGVLKDGALFPVVGRLEHQLQNADDVDTVFLRCNVVVTTMSVIQGCGNEAQARMAEVCSHLFIDEAHHIGAPTWEKFRRAFLKRPILQFTATPYRADGRHVSGKILFAYPLRKAQQEGYFKPINFHAVWELDQARGDQRIAEVAVGILRRDLTASPPRDHILMARAKDIARAEMLFDLYRHHVDLDPVLVHSDLPATEQEDAILKLRERRSRIVVCVNMFGEGFDLPELKIAALHDIHKSLGITLQFTGRFTRSKNERIGDAAMVANIARIEVTDALRDLYAEDSDWNLLLRRLNQGATEQQVVLSEFYDGFSETELPLQNLTPKMSTVVYRADREEWMPEKIFEFTDGLKLYVEPAINRRDRVAAFVVHQREEVPWGEIRDLFDTTFDLYLLHWDASLKLLFVHCSANQKSHDDLAKAVLGTDAVQIQGNQVFRAMHGIKRTMLSNLGLKHTLNRAVRFTMFVGSDIGQGIGDAALLNKITSNLFGYGYEDGERTSAGCSYRGKIWAHLVAANISEWMAWCHHIGTKILDETIDIRSMLSTVLVPEIVDARPALVPLGIEWSEFFWAKDEETIKLVVGGDTRYFYDVGFEMLTQDTTSTLRFRVFTDQQSAEYEMRFVGENVYYVPVVGSEVEIIVGRKPLALSKWFQMEPPIIRFEDGAFLWHNGFFALKQEIPPFDVSRLEAWDWTGTDITVESQGLAKDPVSVQRRVIEECLSLDYDVVFDDDNAYEAADVVAIKMEGNKLKVHLIHCKFSSKPKAGARVDDLYVVCGQAQGSVNWKHKPQRLLNHLQNRESKRMAKGGPSRFEKGDLETLNDIHRHAPYLEPEFEITIVQPGVSQGKISDEMLKLLAVTELYLMDTFAIPMRVIVSS